MTEFHFEDEDYLEEKPSYWKKIKTIFFYFVFVLVIVIDMRVFSNFYEWGSSISILILELIFILNLARICDIEYLELLTEKILNYTKER